jgi:hypothetical protein
MVQCECGESTDNTLGFSGDPLHGHRALRGDLQWLCSDLLAGDGVQFAAFKEQRRRIPDRFQALPA